MPVEERAFKQIEERFDLLETKLKSTFLEVEKRLAEAQAQPIGTEERLQELEDLLLLLQLEITKIKERVSHTTEFLAPRGPDVEERLSRMEELLGKREIKEEEGEGVEPLVAEETREGEEAKEEEKEVEEREEEEEERPTKSLIEEVQKILAR